MSASMQGTGLGKRLVTSLERLAADLGAYKTILDCSAENKGASGRPEDLAKDCAAEADNGAMAWLRAAFYEKCGFVQKEVRLMTSRARRWRPCSPANELTCRGTSFPLGVLLLNYSSRWLNTLPSRKVTETVSNVKSHGVEWTIAYSLSEASLAVRLKRLARPCR